MSAATLSGSFLLVDASELRRIQRNLQAYAQVRNKTSVQEILAKKGNDLRINLFKGFWAQRWKKGNKGGGFRLLNQLSRAGKGVLVRLMTLVEPWKSQIPAVDKNGRALSMWQKLVAQEMIRRSAGVGVLGVSFLRKRWAEKGNQRFLIENRTRGFGKAVTFDLKEGEFVITGFTPGLARVASKYGLITGAIRNVSRDIETYLEKKLGPEFVLALHAR